MRLDLYLNEHGFASSRTEAKALIELGAVTVNGKVVTKPSFSVDGDSHDIKVDRTKRQYVSRGGDKLEAALIAFGVSPAGRLCLDVGASSGGFTDCLLQNGATHVIAIDSGRGQLVSSILGDSRVTSIEEYNARYMSRADLDYVPTLAVMDVSFISATLIIPALSECLDSGADFILLIKPQFEVGRAYVGKGGIVKDNKARKLAVDKVIACASEHGFNLSGVIDSPIRGGDGNIEFLAHFIKV